MNHQNNNNENIVNIVPPLENFTPPLDCMQVEDEYEMNEELEQKRQAPRGIAYTQSSLLEAQGTAARYEFGINNQISSNVDDAMNASISLVLFLFCHNNVYLY